MSKVRKKFDFDLQIIVVSETSVIVNIIGGSMNVCENNLDSILDCVRLTVQDELNQIDNFIK